MSFDSLAVLKQSGVNLTDTDFVAVLRATFLVSEDVIPQCQEIMIYGGVHKGIKPLSLELYMDFGC